MDNAVTIPVFRTIMGPSVLSIPIDTVMSNVTALRFTLKNLDRGVISFCRQAHIQFERVSFLWVTQGPHRRLTETTIYWRALDNTRGTGKHSIHSVLTLAPVLLALGSGGGFISSTGKLLSTALDTNPNGLTAQLSFALVLYFAWRRYTWALGVSWNVPAQPAVAGSLHPPTRQAVQPTATDEKSWVLSLKMWSRTWQALWLDEILQYIQFPW